MSVFISDACVQCGACVSDCPRGCLRQTASGICVDPSLCSECGHCIAICPVNAVSNQKYDVLHGYAIEQTVSEIDADNLLGLIHSRRSIRQYKRQKVEQEKIDRIIEAGRYAPTACNFQKNRFIVVRDKLPELRSLILKHLYDEAQEIFRTTDDPLLLYRANLWKQMYEQNLNDPNGEDRLFFYAPVVIVLTSADDRDGGIAAAYMELMAAAQGLGTLYSGYISMGVNTNERARTLLGLKKEENVMVGMLVGYSAVRYKRVPPRAAAKVDYL